jgi:hypothetical protein
MPKAHTKGAVPGRIKRQKKCTSTGAKEKKNMPRTNVTTLLPTICLAAALSCVTIAACGRASLSGTYLPKGGGMGNGLVMQKLEFGSGNSVTLTMMEQRVRVTYTIDGKQLLLNANGQQMVFDIGSDGCLDGGNLFGKFCKG